MALVFPFVDYYNGLLMVYKRTKVTIFSQSAKFIVTLIALIIGVNFAAQWNGVIGAIGTSFGFLAELMVVGIYVHAIERTKGQPLFVGIKALTKK